jgi:DNA-binding LytR/AlgR family response regulator
MTLNKILSMNKIECLIVDDEPPALNLLEGYVLKTPFLHLAGKCPDAISALEIIGSQPIDLLFLDIQMPELSGIELSRTLNNNIKVIFTTAFQQYAIDGYKVDAIDYLLKPFSYEEFLKAANKAYERIKLEIYSLHYEQPMPVLFVRSGYKLVKIQLEKVLYIEGLKDYVKIYLTDSEKPILTLMSLKVLEEKLLPERFMRIHRSFIINLSRIQAVERSQVLIGNERITIRDQYLEKFEHYISSRSIPTRHPS